MENTIKKREDLAFGKKIYLLGEDSDGVRYWLEKAEWCCGWYWGGGYVETYTNNRLPSKSRDIASHQHFNSLFFDKRKSAYEAFNDFFVKHPFTDKELWQICELMRSFYIARNYSDMLHNGGTNYTTSPAKEAIKNDDEYARINKKVIPEIMTKLYEILRGEAK